MASQKPRYDTLDAWRGLACLLVVVFHSVPYVTGSAFAARIRANGGSVGEWILVLCERFWIGVPLFFVISGYCIAACAEAVRVRGGGVGRYFLRRFRRIYPPLAAAMALGIVVAVLLPDWLTPPPSPDGKPLAIDPTALSTAQWIGNLTLTEEWRPALGGPPRHYHLGQTWTLCYEEQFYLTVGVLLLVARRRFFTGIGIVTALVMLNLLNLNAFFGNRLGMDLNRFRFDVPGFFTNGLWVPFAAGVAVYYRLHKADTLGRIALQSALALFALYWVIAEIDPLDARQSLAKFNAVGCAFAFALCCLHAFDHRLSTTRVLAPFRLCGRMCYSLYLTHTLVAIPIAWACFRAGLTSPAATLLITVPVAMTASIALGYLFYRTVECRFLNAPVVNAPTHAETERASAVDRPSPIPPLASPVRAGVISSTLSG